MFNKTLLICMTVLFTAILSGCATQTQYKEEMDVVTTYNSMQYYKFNQVPQKIDKICPPIPQFKGKTSADLYNYLADMIQQYKECSNNNTELRSFIYKEIDRLEKMKKELNKGK